MINSTQHVQERVRSLTRSASEDQVFHNLDTQKHISGHDVTIPLSQGRSQTLAGETDAVSITEASASFVITPSSGEAREFLRRNVIFAETYVD